MVFTFCKSERIKKRWQTELSLLHKDSPIHPIHSLIFAKKSLKYIPATKTRISEMFRNPYEILAFPRPKITHESYYVLMLSDASVPC